MKKDDEWHEIKIKGKASNVSKSSGWEYNFERKIDLYWHRDLI